MSTTIALAPQGSQDRSVREVARALAHSRSLDEAVRTLRAWGVLDADPPPDALVAWLSEAALLRREPSFAGRQLGELRLGPLAISADHAVYGPVQHYAGRLRGQAVWVRLAPLPGPIGLLVWEEEAAILDNLRGTAGVVRLVGAGEQGDQAWMAYERPAGGTLVRYADRRWEADVIVAVVGGLIAALSAVHDAGVVHGALSPGVVHIDRHRGPLLDGFDVAAARRLFGGDAHGPAETCAPECAHGSAPIPASDRYGAGCLGWWMATGRWPFERPTDRAVRSAQQRAPLPGPVPRPGTAVTPELRALLQRLLSRNPERRTR